MIKDRILALYDSHIPENIPLRTLFDFIADFKPTKIIFGGDNADLDCISHWNDANFKNVGFNNITRQLKQEANQVADIIAKMKRLCAVREFYYIVGNHENWIAQFAAKYPQVHDLYFEELFSLDKLCVRVIPFEPGHDYLREGHLFFRHGHQYTTQNHAKAATTKSHKTMVIGHHHGYETWSDDRDVEDNDQHVGIVVPCYCKKNPGYGKGQPNRWMNGFFTACVKPSGKFSHHVQLCSPEGKFINQMGTCEYE